MTIDYRRQSSLFDQRRFKDGRVTIIGSGPMTNYALCLLSGLGAGTIKVLSQDTVRGFEISEFMIGKEGFGLQKVKCLENRVREMNPDIQIAGRSIGADIAFMGRPHVIVDLTNEPISKRQIRNLMTTFKNRYEECQKIIFASADECSTTITTEKIESPLERRIQNRRTAQDQMRNLENYAGKRQGGLTSAIGAALVVDEIRKALHPLERDTPQSSPITITIESPNDLSSKHALIVGAGGIGTYVGLNLAIMGIGKIDVYDPDKIDAHNLNRQLLYYGRVGYQKAATFHERLQRINPRINIQSHDVLFTEDTSRAVHPKQYDVIFSCLDSFSGRKMLSDFAVRTKTPLINGIVTTFDANVDVYLPGQNPCIDCRYDYASLSWLDDRPASCANQEANVVMPNAMAGAIMVNSSIHIFANRKDHNHLTKRFMYTSGRKDRHKLMWTPITTEKDTLACDCMEVSR